MLIFGGGILVGANFYAFCNYVFTLFSSYFHVIFMTFSRYFHNIFTIFLQDSSIKKSSIKKSSIKKSSIEKSSIEKSKFESRESIKSAMLHTSLMSFFYLDFCDGNVSLPKRQRETMARSRLSFSFEFQIRAR